MQDYGWTFECRKVGRGEEWIRVCFDTKVVAEWFRNYKVDEGYEATPLVFVPRVA